MSQAPQHFRAPKTHTIVMVAATAYHYNVVWRFEMYEKSQKVPLRCRQRFEMYEMSPKVPVFVDVPKSAWTKSCRSTQRYIHTHMHTYTHVHMHTHTKYTHPHPCIHLIHPPPPQTHAHTHSPPPPTHLYITLIMLPSCTIWVYTTKTHLNC